MSAKPDIVLVHGFWGGAAHWAKVIVELDRRGFDALHAVENPLTVGDPAWKRKPCWYQVSRADRMIHPDNERRMAERMGPRKTIELDASHASLASQPVAIADLIDEAAGGVAVA
jgi:pimeloyl-ACP methyl ester carboxylesterase